MVFNKDFDNVVCVVIYYKVVNVVFDNAVGDFIVNIVINNIVRVYYKVVLLFVVIIFIDNVIGFKMIFNSVFERLFSIIPPV